METDRQALKLAQTPAPEPVYADDGVYAGLLTPTGWDCGSCPVSGTGGRAALLAHDAEHQDGAA